MDTQRHPDGDFNPRSPRGERRASCLPSRHADNISIHAPRGGSDKTYILIGTMEAYISIHAPRGGSDTLMDAIREIMREISIHAPRGGSDN